MKNIIKILTITLGLLLFTNTARADAGDLLNALLTENRTIHIIGVIDEGSAINIASQLKALDKTNHNEIEIDITSPGGSVYSGLQILDAMATVKSPIKTVCEGYCMSMAAVILASGTHGHRLAMPLSTILIHQVSTQSQGTLAEMQNEMNETVRLQNLLTSILKQDTGLDDALLTKSMGHDNYMTPTQAKTLNLIDGIVGK